MPLDLDRLLRSIDRVNKLEEFLYVGDLQRILDSFVHSNKKQTAPILLVSDVRAYHGANASRIHIRDIAEIQHQYPRSIGANFRLKFEQATHGERPREAQNALSIFWACNIFNYKSVLWHREILVLSPAGSVKAMLILDNLGKAT